MNTGLDLPQDPALPQLARALDPAVMADVFSAALMQPTRWSVQACRVDRVKYRPGRSCSVAYELDLQHLDTGRALVQRIAARVCSGDSTRRLERAASQPGTASAPGPSLQHVPSLDLLAWWWPNDARLPATQVLADPLRLREEVLPAVVASLSGGRGVLRGHELEVIQYVPESRVTARFDLAWQDGAGNWRQRVFAKAGTEPGGATAHGLLRTLQDSPAWRNGRLRTPAALLWQPAFDLHWQRCVAGVPLLDPQAPATAGTAATLGAQLAALHRTPVDLARQLTPALLRQRLDTVLTVLQATLDGSGAALAAAAGPLARGIDCWAHHDLATLHGDLHPRNILVDGDRVSLIDLDGMRLGAAVLELGAWQADGIYRALLAGEDPLRDRHAWQLLLDGYARAGGARPQAAALRWSTAWNLLTQRAWRCVVNLKPGRMAIAPALVALAAEWATQAPNESAA